MRNPLTKLSPKQRSNIITWFPMALTVTRQFSRNNYPSYIQNPLKNKYLDNYSESKLETSFIIFDWSVKEKYNAKINERDSS